MSDEPDNQPEQIPPAQPEENQCQPPQDILRTPVENLPED